MIDRHGPEPAAEIVGAGIRRLANTHGQAALHSDTITRFRVRLLAHVCPAIGAGRRLRPGG